MKPDDLPSMSGRALHWRGRVVGLMPQPARLMVRLIDAAERGEPVDVDELTRGDAPGCRGRRAFYGRVERLRKTLRRAGMGELADGIQSLDGTGLWILRLGGSRGS